jgi:hypothetical protein
VQRRLETGLDLTQAELRALQREARSQSDQAEDSENTITAVRDPLSFLPPTRPQDSSPDENWHQAADSESHPDTTEAGVSRQEEFGNLNEVTSSQTTGEVGRSAEAREEVPAEDSYGDSIEESRSTEGGEFLSTSGEDLRAAVNEIFSGENFSFEADPDSAFYEEELSSQEEYLEEDWDSQRETLFGGQQKRRGEDLSQEGYIGSGESPGSAAVSDSKLTAEKDTLVLFLVQVPEGGLAATFKASEDTGSPFAGQLRLSSKESAVTPGEASEFDVNLPPEGLVRLSMGKVGNNGHEWALISLDEEARAYATFDLRAGRNLNTTAAVFSKTPSRMASIPLMTSLNEDCGLVLANPTNAPVTVKLSLFSEEGHQVGSLTSHEPLPPGKQIAVFAKGVFRDTPGISSFRGRMVAEVVGEGLIWSAGLDQSDGVLSFLPVHEMEKSSKPLSYS